MEPSGKASIALIDPDYNIVQTIAQDDKDREVIPLKTIGGKDQATLNIARYIEKKRTNMQHRHSYGKFKIIQKMRIPE